MSWPSWTDLSRKVAELSFLQAWDLKHSPTYTMHKKVSRQRSNKQGTLCIGQTYRMKSGKWSKSAMDAKGMGTRSLDLQRNRSQQLVQWSYWVWMWCSSSANEPWLQSTAILVFLTYDTLSSETTEAVTKALNNIFRKFGLPERIISDNSPCFKSEKFRCSCDQLDIGNVTSSPYHH